MVSIVTCYVAGMNPVERFAIIGDIHAEDEALARALAFSRAQGVDAILAVGDIVDGHGDAGACRRPHSRASRGPSWPRSPPFDGW